MDGMLSMASRMNESVSFVAIRDSSRRTLKTIFSWRFGVGKKSDVQVKRIEPLLWLSTNDRAAHNVGGHG